MEITNRNLSPNSEIVVINLPGGVDQAEAKLFPVTKMNNSYIVPISERNSPIITSFIRNNSPKLILNNDLKEL